MKTFLQFLKKFFGNTKDEELMEILLRLSGKSIKSLQSLSETLSCYDNQDKREELFLLVGQLKGDGDDLIRQANDKISSISISSWIGHENSSELVGLMGILLRNSRRVIRALQTYQLEGIINEAKLLGDIIGSGAEQISSMMSLFCIPNWQKNREKIRLCIEKISRLETDGDKLKADGLSHLYNDSEDPVLKLSDLRRLIGSKELIKNLEVLTDDINRLATKIRQIINS